MIMIHVAISNHWIILMTFDTQDDFEQIFVVTCHSQGNDYSGGQDSHI